MSRLLRVAALWVLVAAGSTAWGQAVGDCVSLKPKEADLGVPLHEKAGKNSFRGRRLPIGSTATVDAIDPESGWLYVRTGTFAGWITPRYVQDVVDCGSAAFDETPTCCIGTWNLEWFKDGAGRGFPETPGQIPPRTAADFQELARVIGLLELRLIVLQEINGATVTVDGEEEDRSRELEALIVVLGDNWDYIIGSSGGSQRVAMLFDTTHIGLNWWCEPDLPNPRIDGKRLFDRAPLVGYFTLFQGGVERNDFAVVGIHMASGQANVRNHDQAMTHLLDWLADTAQREACIPADEADVIIAGDLNANRFDGYAEDFWSNMESNGWDVLADEPSYPATRLSGTPLMQRESRIDYIIVSARDRGCQGEEVRRTTAHVRVDLLDGTDAASFRRRLSDHLPVTVQYRVMDDTDQ